MATDFPFNDYQNGAEIRERLNAMWADWLAALETAVGKDGWSPLLRTVADGQRQVIELYDWIGGTTAKPATGFMGAAGLVVTAAEAVDFRGPQGDKGDDGDTGPANQLATGTIATGAPGSNVEASVTGVYPNQVLNLTIPRGDKGATGDTPTVTVGTVTTGAPGTNAEVVPSGTPTELVLNFTIPRGDPGAGGGGSGDVVGPSGVDDLQLAQFDGPTGKLIRAMNLTGILAVDGGRPYVATAGTDYATPSQLDDKVDKVPGKGLSENDFTDADVDKLDGIAANATANATDSYLLDRANHTGEQAISTVTELASTLSGKQAALVSGSNIKTINGQDITGPGNIEVASGAGIGKIAYTDRAALRTLEGEYALVDALGLFEFETGSTLADDDESCFATATGRWILRCPSFDLIEAWNLPQRSMLPARFVFGRALCPFTAVVATTTVAFSVLIGQAEPTDSILITPPDLVSTGALTFHGYCVDAGVVRVAITNPTGATVAVNPGAQGYWQVLLVKAD